MTKWTVRTATNRMHLAQTALDLFAERGYDQTPAAEIARHAGLTERSFFRYFADKREVLFGDADAFRARLVEVVLEAPGSTQPAEAVLAALVAGLDMFQDRWGFARQRQAIIAGHPALQERELTKLSTAARAISDALQTRGVEESVAVLTAEAGVVVFRVAFERWLDGDGSSNPGELMGMVWDELTAATSRKVPGPANRFASSR